ncbi:sugar phosphate nucleotidyltransferase [Nitrosopumilus sp. b2]|uniref:sugar phosphate nucleotidyltransferase n=1 Tax=Nitrosopumilus sp. b2 TaxID=2109908 RepID=UPI0015F5EE50|nr:sugar phosphate nucleotidyltransferase [Nitrosopumilus sp. b2]KAF6245789.1 glucose-1-phosphate cytidylyltransferase [Nitrosopumilus sp. b2]
MKCVLLAGGKGTRLIEETLVKPKPLIEIGGKPILWHIMKSYSHYGINEFIICSGYKGEMIKNYFEKEDMLKKENWTCQVIDTGLDTMTGGRLKRIKKYVENDTFCFTYGDTVNNLNITKLINFHKKMGLLATVTACIPPEKYGVLYLKGDLVEDFKEKPRNEKNWVNGGYFVLEPGVFDYIKNDNTVWEEEPMKNLVRDNKLAAFRHDDFYQPMDMMRDKLLLNDLLDSGKAKWKVWD